MLIISQPSPRQDTIDLQRLTRSGLPRQIAWEKLSESAVVAGSNTVHTVGWCTTATVPTVMAAAVVWPSRSLMAACPGATTTPFTMCPGPCCTCCPIATLPIEPSQSIAGAVIPSGTVSVSRCCPTEWPASPLGGAEVSNRPSRAGAEVARVVL